MLSDNTKKIILAVVIGGAVLALILIAIMVFFTATDFETSDDVIEIQQVDGIYNSEPPIETEAALPLPENTPAFSDVNTAMQNLEPYVFLDWGWEVYHPHNSPYVYAYIPRSFGLYLIRYNIPENSIDRAVHLEEIPPNYMDWHFSFSPDGEFALSYNSDPFSKFPETNFFLLDFENSEAIFLAQSREGLNNEGLNPEQFPYPESFSNSDTIGWETEIGTLDFEIEQGFLEDIRKYIAIDDQGEKHELTTLKNNGFESKFVVVDSQTIVALLPVYDNRPGDLGHYKFALINVADDTIIQECAINE